MEANPNISNKTNKGLSVLKLFKNLRTRVLKWPTDMKRLLASLRAAAVSKAFYCLRLSRFYFKYIFRRFLRAVRLYVQKVDAYIKVSIAKSWNRYYWASLHTRFFAYKNRGLAALLIGIVAALASFYFLPQENSALLAYFNSADGIDRFRSFVLSEGCALIGAAAIALTIILFAMQTNIERIPYGLFKRFSSDARLLSSFLGVFAISLTITYLSAFVDESSLVSIFLITGWGTILVIVLFMYGYNRALTLISPARQLGLLVEETQKEFAVWVKRSKRATPLYLSMLPAEMAREAKSDAFDYMRDTYFKANPHWTNTARKNLQLIISFSRRAIEQADHELAASALSGLLTVNAAYINAKGKTFISVSPLMMDDSGATDTFINETLEYLRQNTKLCLAKGDETLLEQTYDAFHQLIKLYLAIEYSSPLQSKWHAALAFGYFEDALKAAITHKMPDVIMKGVKIIGSTAFLFMACEDMDHTADQADEIGIVSAVGIADQRHRPVLQTGMQELASLLLKSFAWKKRNDMSRVIKSIKDSINMLTMMFLEIPDNKTFRFHGAFLAPYYSTQSNSSFVAVFLDIANKIAAAPADDADFKKICRNIKDWADELFKTEKDVLLKSVTKRASFTHEVMNWIEYVCKGLLHIANSPVCEDYIAEELRKQAIWLASTISWIPGDKDTVAFVENYQVTQTLYEIALAAHQYNAPDVFKETRDLLFDWTFKAGAHQTGWGSLERAICGLICLAVVQGEPPAPINYLKASLTTKLAENGISPEIRQRTARALQERIRPRYGRDFGFDVIDRHMRSIPEAVRNAALTDIVAILNPPPAPVTAPLPASSPSTEEGSTPPAGT